MALALSIGRRRNRMEALTMGAQRSEFVFSVDTDEVTGVFAPPTPVIAAPRRRVTAPTVALRLPDLRQEVSPPPAASIPAVAAEAPFAQARVSFEPPVAQFAPTLSLPMAPRAEGADQLASLDDLARQSVAQLTGHAPPASPNMPTAETAAVAVAEAEAYWKNPKFMLAGVAAAFLGMVSLIAMNHEDKPVADEAPRWTGPSVAMPERVGPAVESDRQTPRVTRGEPAAELSADEEYAAPQDAGPTARTAALPPEWNNASPRTSTAVDEPWIDPATGRERIDFGDEAMEEEGTARIVPPLPNLATPTAREASQAPAGQQGAYR